MHVCVGNPLQYSRLENPMDRVAWQATGPGVAKNQTRLKQLSTHACACPHTGTYDKSSYWSTYCSRSLLDFSATYVSLPSSPCKGEIIGHVLGQWRMTWRLERWSLGDLSWARGCWALTPVLPCCCLPCLFLHP